jgi:tetratricopeptide (TPR) repeat protein
MKKEQFFFLLGGFAFGILVGFAVFKVYADRPMLDPSGAQQLANAPAGSRSPAQQAPQGGGGDGGAPMVAEINELKRKLEANPQDVAAATDLARMYFRVGMMEQSLEFSEIALRITPDDPNLLTDTGNVLRQLGRHVEALEHFRAAHEADPTHWQSIFNTVVVAAFDLQQFDLADAAMARLDGFDPPPAQLPELKQAVEEFRVGHTADAGTP